MLNSMKQMLQHVIDVLLYIKVRSSRRGPMKRLVLFDGNQRWLSHADPELKQMGAFMSFSVHIPFKSVPMPGLFPKLL